MSTKTRPTSARKFSDLRAEAMKDVVITAPYVLEFGDGDTISITAPTQLERTTGIASMVRGDASFDHADAKHILALFCGEDVFPRIWEEFRQEHTNVMVGLVNELIDHFKVDLERDRAAADAPGGSDSSSS